MIRSVVASAIGEATVHAIVFSWAVPFVVAVIAVVAEEMPMIVRASVTVSYCTTSNFAVELTPLTEDV
jgi:hypothetical protein